MNPRERVLALGVGGLAVVVAMFFGYSWISNGLSVRKDQVANLRQKLAQQKKLVLQTEAAKRKIADWQQRSLPPQPTLASSLYGAWLLDRVMEAKLTAPKVTPGNPVQERDLYNLVSYTVNGKGDLRQIVDFLHAFYSTDFLHRITKLTIAPAKEPKQLTIGLSVEVLSMVGAPDAKQLALRPASRLEKATREEYVTAIVNRNLFGPPNQPPRLSGLGSAFAETGSAFSASAKVSDADAADKHTFTLAKSDVPEARLDAGGTLSFRPRRPGKYEFEISVADDGFPSLKTTEKLVVTVSDPLPPAPVARVPTFDEAKYTVLAGVVDKNGTGQVWLHVRPRERNSMVKLGVGDEFEIGSVKGIVKSIGTGDFVFESAGELRKLDSGVSLDKAAPLVQ